MYQGVARQGKVVAKYPMKKDATLLRRQLNAIEQIKVIVARSLYTALVYHVVDVSPPHLNGKNDGEKGGGGDGDDGVDNGGKKDGKNKSKKKDKVKNAGKKDGKKRRGARAAVGKASRHDGA